MSKIHPTAIVDDGAKIHDTVEIGPYVIIESDVVIGAGCILRPHAVIRKFTTMGEGNYVDSFVVLGGNPQDVKFDPASESYVKIGNNNLFREGVTINRATTPGGMTAVGDDTFFMTGSHAGHDSTIGDRVVFVNGASAAGHSTIGTGAFISGTSHVHQFCWVGEMCMFQGLSGLSTHLPPYTMLSQINHCVGLNRVGLRRAEHITKDDRKQISEAFRLTYKAGLTTPKALKKMDACTDWALPASKFRDFVRKVLCAQKPFIRALCPFVPHKKDRTR